MNQIVTTGIVLNRINYGEADRIITIITPDHGKLRLMAKGVRKVKSKLAGGIELFSTSNVTFIPGKRDIGTLVSTRLITHWGNIIAQLPRTMLGYEILKSIDKVTQDNCEEEYYQLAVSALGSLNNKDVSEKLIELWFRLNLLKQLGHEPNLKTDTKGTKLEEGEHYTFDFDHMAFAKSENGKYTDKHIKLLRLLITQSPEKLATIQDVDELILQLEPLVKTMYQAQTA